MSDWTNITPTHDSTGRLLTFMERFQRACATLGAEYRASYDSMSRKIAREPNLTPAERDAVMNKVSGFLRSKLQDHLTRIALDLEMEHQRLGPPGHPTIRH